MKKILYAIVFFAAALGMTSCMGNGVEDTYKTWREANDKWFTDQTILMGTDGKLFYEPVTAPWDPNARVLVHWFNDRKLTQDNLSPIYTSTVDVKYIARLYDGTKFDSSYVSTSPADSLVRLTINSCVEGWGIAIPKMHVGDSCRIVINYPQGYGTYGANGINPYSALQFDVKLVNIYKYETK